MFDSEVQEDEQVYEYEEEVNFYFDLLENEFPEPNLADEIDNEDEEAPV